MSILLQLFHKQITFHEAAAKVEQWGVQVTPVLGAAVPELVSDVKQAASDAISMADTFVGSHAMTVAASLEVALEGALGTLTHGISTPFNPLISDAIDRLALAAKQQADAWSLEAKAKLAPAAGPTINPRSQP